MVIEIWLVYFSCAKADYVPEIPVVSGIPVQDVSLITKYHSISALGDV